MAVSGQTGQDPEPGRPGRPGPGTLTAAETPDAYGAYPRLGDGDLARLAPLGRTRAVAANEELFRAGDRVSDFIVVLAGSVAIVAGYGTADQEVIGVHGAGRFLGELGVLTGEAAYYTAVAADDGEVLAVPVDRLAEEVSRNAALGEVILRAYLIRRSLLRGLGVGLRIVGSRFSPDARRLRDFVARNRLPAQWLDLEEDREAEALLRQLGVAPAETPIVILYGRRLLRNPSNGELAAAVGLPAPSLPQASCELLVVGAGPAGLSAAVYGASEGLETVVLDGMAAGGQAGTSSRIENYLGFPSGISGDELAVRAALQARKFGVRLAVPAEATAVHADDGHYTVCLADGGSATSRFLMVASGARYRRPDVPRLDHFERTSVYYAASQAEAMLCRGDPVAILGGGNSAGQAAVFLAQHASQITLIAPEHDLGSSMSRYLISQLERLRNVRLMLGARLTQLTGDDMLAAVTVVAEDRTSRDVPARALFVFIGAAPSTGWLSGLVALDERGFVRTGRGAEQLTGQDLASRTDWRPSMLETSQPGVFAVGDVRSGSTKRVAAAVGEGAMAIHLVFART
jgi:thioredoxin reductase (NADPH)